LPASCRPPQPPARSAFPERVVVCDHLDGTVSILLNEPAKGERPVVLFTNRTPRR
jgi:hypothetical protein